MSTNVKFGLFVAPFEELADPRRVAELAAVAEDVGWDGLFLWDHMLADPGMAVGEAWTTLAAIAMTTGRMRIGTMVTPLSRRRPWVLARQISAIDQLSGGRLVVGIGLGDDGWREFSAFGEVAEPVPRGRILDESLEVLQRLLNGADVDFDGDDLTVHTTAFLPRPVQNPVPFWAACRWPNRRPLARAARLQGCFPIFRAGQDSPPPPSAADLIALRGVLREFGAAEPYDIAVRVALHRMDAGRHADRVAELAEVGVTWALQAFAPGRDAAGIEAVVRAGPPA
jgi:alkanesulfonate monooxygenase SsuD/methylene tetrahydromethanopterin reductase-like flavin-dependent oxidoreductase (luciferase family)